jgi:hypothetical protein
VEQGGDEAQVAGHGRLQGKERQDGLVDLHVATVDAVVVGHDHGGELDVLLLDRLEHAVERADDEVEAAERLLLQRAQLVEVVGPRHQPPGGAHRQPTFPLT